MGLKAVVTFWVYQRGTGVVAMWVAKRFWRSKSGATSIEYAIIGFFLSILVVAGATTIGTKLVTKITPISNNLN